MMSDRFYQMRYDDPYQRAIWEPILRKTSALYPIARRDPIFTPLFTSFFATLGFSATTAAILGSATTAIVTTAVSIGVQAMLAPKPPKPEDGKVPKIQSVPYRWWGVGRNRIAGAYMLWEAKGSKLYSVQALAGHRIKSINRYWLHDDEIQLNPDGTSIGIGGGGGVQRYGSRVRIDHRLGLPTETAYAPIVADLSSEGIWTNNHRGDGQASVSMIAKDDDAENQQQRYPFGPPSLSVEADMALCWDYRDPAQDPENPSTWTWTQNTALQMCWHQCFNEFGHKRDYRRAILPLLDMWKEEADICDEDVPLAGGGVEKRYQSNGFDTAENDPKAATNALLAACDGWICERGDGALMFIVGKFREKYVETLTDADLVGHNIEYDVLFEDEVNRLIPKFNYPAIGYATSDTDFFDDTAAQLTAGRVLARDANYQWVQQWRQARRLGKRDWLRLQQKVSGQLSVRLSGINAIYARWVRLSTPITLPRLNGKLVENRKAILALQQGGFSVDIVQHPENIDEWTPATDEGQQPPVPPKPNAANIVTPVINLIQARANAGSVFIRIVIVDPADDSLTPVVRYRVANNGSGSPGAWITNTITGYTSSMGFIDLNTPTVPADQLLEVQVAFRTSKGSTGEWSVTENVTSTADPNPPAAVTAASATGGAGQATFNWTAPNSANYAGAKIYYNTVNSFSSASYVGPPEYGAPSTVDSVVKTIPAGVKYGWVASINRSGIEGQPTATGSFTVT